MARKQWSLPDTVKKVETNNTGNFNPLSQDQLRELYEAIGAVMSDEHRIHIEQILNEGKGVDPLLELEIVFRVVEIYSLKAVTWALNTGAVTKDIGALLGEARQSATAIENMRMKRAENAAKSKEEDETDLFDPTARKSPLAF